ncbi:MAG: apolipoprotein N-acyltransferase [Candidatus Ornithospirochaeta sp.]|nr:apolipoprotein N-acyltransferase [Sphaerochaetaceae bacterium]MDY5522788.1 apolipoprotein N-acyltransferase [Candidatus Ornithospirochaeta sp.]
MNNFNRERSLRTLCSEVLVLLASAFVLAASFPGFLTDDGIAPLVFVALIPVFMVIRNTTWRCVWFHGFLFGLVYYFFFNYWLKGFHALAIVIAPVIKGGEMLLLFLALKAIDEAFPKKGYILKGAVWAAYAYLAENWFAGYPYGNIVYALYPYPVLYQIADITGIWGIICLMVFPQAAAADYLYPWVMGKRGSFRLWLKSNLIPLIIWALLSVASIIYGIFSLAYWEDRTPSSTMRVACVQHNHDSWKGGYNTYRSNFNNLKRYTTESLVTDPDLVIWSETAFVPSVAWHTTYDAEGTVWEDIHDLTIDFVEYAESIGVPLLTGNPKSVIADPSLPPYDEDGNKNSVEYNTVILFQDGEIKGEYIKQHLVPFTEHFPYEKQLPWLYNLLKAMDYNWWIPGTEPTVFELNGVHFSTPICYEDSFGVLNAEYVANGAEVIINMTNDNWSKKPSAEWQHAEIAAFRSVETRKAMVRGTNSGITCLIVPTGEIQDPMKPFSMGTHTYEVPVYSQSDYGNTFYVEHIDLFAKIAIGVSIAALAYWLIRKLYFLYLYLSKRKGEEK